jgi:hypothetical protein
VYPRFPTSARAARPPMSCCDTACCAGRRRPSRRAG